MIRLFLLFILFSSNLVYCQTYTDLIISRNTGTYTLFDNKTINVFGFTRSLSANVNLPGPSIFVNQGDSAIIELWNVSQGAPHTIHLHGLDVDQQNDGVAHLSFEVPHMGYGTYRFKATHPGTYLYHCHVESPVHVQAGMYGLVIVRPPGGIKKTWLGGYSFHSEKTWLSTEIDTVWHQDSILNQPHIPGNMLHPIKIPKYRPSYFLINGKGGEQLKDSTIALYAKKNEIIYLRLANIGFYAATYYFPAQLNTLMVDSDGRPLPVAEKTDSVTVLPGERFGLILEPKDDLIDSVKVKYTNLNNSNNQSILTIPIRIEGVLGIQESSEEILKIHPNPFSGNLSINSGDLEIISGSIYTSLGTRIPIKAQKLGEITLLLTEDLAPGFYLLQMNTNRGLITKKIIKN
jgi:FtsP/CotA-like multicopper oxidase with cupredoxin domain